MEDTKASLPKYLQISRDLTESIRHGDLDVGDMAMSENEIIDHYGVSNTTARRALQELERAGWVRRIKGKGTVVRGRRVDRSVDRILGFTRNMHEAGLEPSTKLLDIQLRHTSRTLQIRGRTYVLSGPVWVIERLRLADDIPMMEEKRFISAELCPDISKKDLEKSLYDIYEHDYSLSLTGVNQRLSTVLLQHRRLMNLFELETPAPAFLVEGVTFCGRDVILEMEESLYRGDQYQFAVYATRQANQPSQTGTLIEKGLPELQKAGDKGPDTNRSILDCIAEPRLGEERIAVHR